jgi:prophage regulatory protein
VKVSNDPAQLGVPRVMLTIDKVLAIVPVSRTTLFKMEREKRFPPCTYISANRRVWFADEIAAWQEALPIHHTMNRGRG